MDTATEDVPPFFLCPISLQIMQDPVTLTTGVTYDRRSIERWLSSAGHRNCPVTNQPLADLSLTPNTTLLNLIRSWCTSSAEPAVDLSALAAELARDTPDAKALAKVAEMVRNNEVGKSSTEEHGITKSVARIACLPRRPAEITPWETSNSALIDEATIVLQLLTPSPVLMKELAERENGELVAALAATLQKGSYRARVSAVLLLDAALKDTWKVHLPASLFDGAVEILKDQTSSRQTTTTVLSVLLQVAAERRNRTRLVEAGAVAVLVELLVEEGAERRKCEAMLALVELLCRCAEGRAALAEHPAGIAAVAGRMLRVSRLGTEKAAKTLLSVCRWGGRKVAEEMMEVGGVGRVLMVVQIEPLGKAREIAKEILGLHLDRWRKSPCFAFRETDLFASAPV